VELHASKRYLWYAGFNIKGISNPNLSWTILSNVHTLPAPVFPAIITDNQDVIHTLSSH